ncbi:MAG: hypothetical protein R6U98_06260, partial [Pirellulaceae bacterium]
IQLKFVIGTMQLQQVLSSQVLMNNGVKFLKNMLTGSHHLSAEVRIRRRLPGGHAVVEQKRAAVELS